MHGQPVLPSCADFEHVHKEKDMSDAQFDSIEDAIAAIKRGEMIVVVDDDDRENEGDLIMAASKATPEAVAFMIRHTSGILCAPLFEDLAVLRHHPGSRGQLRLPFDDAWRTATRPPRLISQPGDALREP